MRVLNAFKNEPQKTYNMLHRRINAVVTTPDKKLRSKAIKKMLKTLVIYVYSALAVAIAESLAEALRDDSEEKFINKFLRAYLPTDAISTVKDIISTGDFALTDISTIYAGMGNALANINPMILTPLMGTIDSSLKGFDNGRMELQLFNEIGNFAKKMDSDKTTTYGKLYEGAKVISLATGAPISSIMREFKVINNNLLDEYTPWGKLYTSTYTKEKYEREAGEAKYREAIDSNDVAAVKALMRETFDEALKEAKESEKENPESVAWTKVRDQLEKQCKRQLKEGVSKATLKSRYTTLLKATKYKDTGKSSYSNMSDKEAAAKVDSWLK